MNTPERLPVFSAKLVMGLAVIAFGLSLTADSLHWFDASELLRWWPLALAAMGLARLVEDGPLSLRGHIWLALAIAGFISQFGPWGLLERWWPVSLVWAGAVIALRAIFPQPKRIRRCRRDLPSPRTGLSCDPEHDSTQVKP